MITCLIINTTRLILMRPSLLLGMSDVCTLTTMSKTDVLFHFGNCNSQNYYRTRSSTWIRGTVFIISCQLRGKGLFALAKDLHPGFTQNWVEPGFRHDCARPHSAAPFIPLRYL